MGWPPSELDPFLPHDVIQSKTDPRFQGDVQCNKDASQVQVALATDPIYTTGKWGQHNQIRTQTGRIKQFMKRCIRWMTWKRIQDTYVAEKVKARESIPMRMPSSSATPASPSHATLRFSSHRPTASAIARRMNCGVAYNRREVF